MKAVTLCVIALLGLPLSGWSQEEPKTPRRPPPPSTQPLSNAPRTGTLLTSGEVAVGEMAPDFELDGSEGRPVQLSKLRGDWVLLVFSDRKESAGELRASHEDLASKGMRVIAVCREKSGSLKSYAEKTALPFVMLADVTGEISALYGLYDREHSATLPGFLVIDRKGKIRMAVLGQQLPAADIAHLARFAMAEL